MKHLQSAFLYFSLFLSITAAISFNSSVQADSDDKGFPWGMGGHRGGGGGGGNRGGGGGGNRGGGGYSPGRGGDPFGGSHGRPDGGDRGHHDDTGRRGGGDEGCHRGRCHGGYPPEYFPPVETYPPVIIEPVPVPVSSPSTPTLIYGCSVTYQSGEFTESCQSDSNYPIQCYAEIQNSDSTQQRVWGQICVSNVSECFPSGENRVEPCYSE